MLTSRYNAMILECQVEGENVEIITRAYGNVQVSTQHHNNYIVCVIFIGSRALSFSGPLLSLCVEFCMYVCMSATLRSNISKTKGARG